MSKTAGTAVSLENAIERHGPDALRYFLLREIGFEGDGNFTWERFDERYTSDLADGLGNLVSRTLAMLAKYRGWSGARRHQRHGPRQRRHHATLTAYAAAMDRFDVGAARTRPGRLVTEANQYIVRTAPWTLAKEGKEAELDQALASLARCLYRLAVLAAPFLPEKCALLYESLGRTGRPEGRSGTPSRVRRWPEIAPARAPVLFPSRSRNRRRCSTVTWTGVVTRDITNI